MLPLVVKETKSGISLIKKQDIFNKFNLESDLGIMTIPNGYIHEDYPKRFYEKYCKDKRYFFNTSPRLMEGNFHPSRILEPGERIKICAYSEIEKTTYLERIQFLSSKGSVFFGVEGLLMLWEQKRSNLPGPNNYLSFDFIKNLWCDFSGSFRVPSLSIDSKKVHHLNLGYPEEPLFKKSVILGFYPLDSFQTSFDF